jgi:hypothetical protein
VLGFPARSPSSRGNLTRMSASGSHLPVRIWPTVARAVAGKCPACGQGRLFRSYLHQVENCTSCGEHYGKTSRRRRTGLADNPRRRPFGRTVGVICRDHVSLASSGEHNSLAADCGGANIDYSAACENHLHRGNLGDERSGFRMTRLEAQNSSLLRLGNEISRSEFDSSTLPIPSHLARALTW